VIQNILYEKSKEKNNQIKINKKKELNRLDHKLEEKMKNYTQKILNKF